MEKETVLIRLLLKPMTKTSQLNDTLSNYDIPWWVSRAININSLIFAIVLMKIT